MKKINVKISSLRLRETPSLSGKSKGFVSKGIHEYTETDKEDGYKWYHIEEGWCAYIEGDVEEIKDPWIKPIPTAEDLSKNQVSVFTTGLRIRAEASFSGAVQGYCDQGYYDVIDIKGSFAHIGEDSYIALKDQTGAEIDGVRYIPGSSDPEIVILRREVAEIRRMLEACIEAENVKRITALTEAEYKKETPKSNTLYVIK